MSYELKYLGTDKPVLFYKDAFIIYRDILKEAVKKANLDEDIVKLINNDLINVNRAPLILLKRVDSPQPPSINLLNEKIVEKDGNLVVQGKAHYNINMAVFCYGNTYMEAERLGSIVQEALISSSIAKVRALSNQAIVGHTFLGWSGTNFVNQDSKLMYSRVDMAITILIEYETTL